MFIKNLFDLRITRTLYSFLGFLLVFSIVSQVSAQELTPTPSTPPQNAEALQEGIALTLSPTFITLTTNPGEEVKSQFRVVNNNAFSENLEVSVMKFGVGQDGESAVPQDLEPGDDFGEWVEFSEDQFSLSPNQSKTISFTLSPPEDANLGYYYALAIQRTQAVSADGSTPQAVVSGIAVLPVLLEVRSPNARRDIQIVEFKTDKLFYEFLPTTFQVNIENKGNVHVVPFGNVFIDSMFNDEVAILSINPGRGNVLPGVKRIFDVVWDDAFAVRVPKEKDGAAVVDENGSSVLSTKYDFTKANKFRIGKYTANMIMVYDNGERDVPIEAQVSFWIIPWRLILGGLLLVAAPAVIVYIFMKWRYGRRK